MRVMRVACKWLCLATCLWLWACGGEEAAGAGDAAGDAAGDVGSGADAAASDSAGGGDDTATSDGQGAVDGSGACASAADCATPADACLRAVCVDGVCGTAPAQGAPCEDGAACTVGDACKDGACVAGVDLCLCHQDADCQKGADPCGDKRVCDVTALPWRCVEVAASAVTCAGDSGNPCVKEVCKPETATCVEVATSEAWLDCKPSGCVWRVAPKGLPPAPPAACDDGDACTAGDACVGASCKAGAPSCVCASDADCPDDGNLCNGKPYCDTSTPGHACKTNPATVVTCDVSGDTACSKTICMPGTGACLAHPVSALVTSCGPAGCTWAVAPPGAATATVACDDGNACTTGEVCQGTSCVASADVCKCDTDADCDGQEDGDVCNGTLYCDKQSGACKVNPATVVQCPTVDDSACLKRVCYPKTGLCQLAPVELTEQACGPAGCGAKLLPPGKASAPTGCDDNDSCTTGEVCKAGACQGGTDTCACEKDADCAKLEDGDACNGLMYCHKAKQQCQVNPASIAPCPSVGDTACLKNACVPATGNCAATPVGKTLVTCHAGANNAEVCVRAVKADAETQNLACDDGDACTAGDVCAGGSCKPGATVCSCKTDSDCVALDDGNLCNGLQYCDKQSGSCKLNPSSAVICKTVDDTACLVAACSPKAGSCALTVIEATVKVCDAGGSCRREVAPPGETTPTVAPPCEDGQPCTKGDTCAGGSCKAGVFTCECATSADCKDKDDGDACNGTLYCDKSDPAAPACKLNPATVVTCPKSQDPCLVTVCNPLDGGCVAVAGNAGLPCDDGSLCTANDACKAGVCTGAALDCDDGSACTNDTCTAKAGCVHAKANCDDGNGCTVDSCDPKTGKCSFAPADAGSSCDADGSGCTVNDTCQAGLCKAGAMIQCSLPTGPCELAVCVPNGATQYACKVAAKGDGAACDDGDACSALSLCAAGTCSGAGKDRYFQRAYAPPLAEGWLSAVAPTSDGGLIAVGGAVDTGGSGSTTAAWWLVRVDASGAPLWQATSPTTGTAAGHAAHDVSVESDGTSWVIGAGRSAKGDLDMRLQRYNPAGKLAFSLDVGSAGVDEVATAGQVDSFGSTTLVGYAGAADATAASATRLSPSGDALWSLEVKVSGESRSFAAMRPGPDGGLWLAGSRVVVAASRSYGMLTLVDKAGKVVRERVLGDGKADVRLSDLVVGDAGGLLAVGSVGTVAAPAAYLVGVEADLYPRWSETGAAGTALHGVARLDKGRLVAVGRALPLGGVANAWIRGLDEVGVAQWTRTLQAGGSQRLWRVAPVGVDGAVAAGEREVDGARHGLLVRIGAFGHTSCADAGACLLKSAGACDDGKPCTLDGCEAKGGCTTAAAEGARCEPGDTCSDVSACANGTCSQTASGRLHLGTHVPGGVYGGGWRLAVLDDGGVAAAGSWYDSTQRSAALRVDERFDYKWHATTTGGTQSYARAIAAVPGGGAMVLGRDSGGGWAVRRYNASGGQVWAQGNSMLSGKDAVDLDAVDGNHFVLCAQSGYGQYDWRAVTVLRFNAGGTVIGTQVFNVTRFDPAAGACDANNQCYGKNGAWGVGNLSCAAAANGVVHVVGTLSKIWCNNNHSDRNLFYARIGTNGVIGSTPWIASKGSFGAWSEHNWNAQLTPNNYEYAQAVEAMSDNGALISAIQGSFSGYDCQWDQALGNRTALIIRTNASGQRLWHLAYNAGGDFRPIALGAYPGGGALIGGYVAIGNANYPRVELRDAGGNAIFAKNLPTTGFIGDMAALPGGDIAVTGAGGGWLMGRIDRWGHTGCAAAGKCAAHGLDACDDSQACTTQTCSAANGCTYTPLTGTSCNDGDACTSSDVCTSSGTCKGAPIGGCGG